MVRPKPIHVVHEEYLCSTPLAIGLFISISVLVALCTQHSRKGLRKYTNQYSTAREISPRSPSPPPKADSSADPPLIIPRRNDEESEAENHEEGGLWQKAILMGEKCHPPDFSGVLFYDSYGNRISELPRSPRAIRVPISSLTDTIQ